MFDGFVLIFDGETAVNFISLQYFIKLFRVCFRINAVVYIGYKNIN